MNIEITGISREYKSREDAKLYQVLSGHTFVSGADNIPINITLFCRDYFDTIVMLKNGDKVPIRKRHQRDG
jgi:hypothetical protein